MKKISDKFLGRRSQASKKPGIANNAFAVDPNAVRLRSKYLCPICQK